MMTEDVRTTESGAPRSPAGLKECGIGGDTGLLISPRPPETSRDSVPIIPRPRRDGAAESSSGGRHSVGMGPPRRDRRGGVSVQTLPRPRRHEAGATPPTAALQVRALSKTYFQRQTLSRSIVAIPGLTQVDLTLQVGCTLAVVGESGSGKSTLARCMALLEHVDSGEIWLDGKNLLTLKTSELRRARRKIQVIFQDPARALNPRFSAVELVAEPLEILRWETDEARRRRVLDLMEEVGLSRQWGSRRALEFSGGQRQRLAIARALALEPRILILDEALSALDLPLQVQIMKLLLDLQALHGFSYVLISHDLRLVGQVVDEVAVMHQGSVVEQGKVRDLFAAPQHSATQALLESC
jgi:ABC-type glutathione transport system ATPase component